MTPAKIAIIVPNPCNPDYRVIRQAESLAAAGHEVRLYATKKPETPAFERFNGVNYYRSSWNIVRDFILWSTRAYRMRDPLYATRRDNSAVLERARRKAIHTTPDVTPTRSPSEPG